MSKNDQDVDDSDFMWGVDDPDCMPVDIEQLTIEWNKLTLDEQAEIYSDFVHDCIRGGSEPCNYWHPLLMPMAMEGYVGH